MSGYGPQVTLNNLYNPNSVFENSLEETIQNGTSETDFLAHSGTHEAWVAYQSITNPWVTMDTKCAVTETFQQILDFGPENILFTACDTAQYLSVATSEESSIISMYSTDLTTYLDEVCTNLITGKNSPDEYEELIQYAYDNLYLSEVLDAYQARANRTLTALGLDPIT